MENSFDQKRMNCWHDKAISEVCGVCASNGKTHTVQICMDCGLERDILPPAKYGEPVSKCCNEEYVWLHCGECESDDCPSDFAICGGCGEDITD